ncbi:HPr family phosphocarrier protein [Glycomyces terrestris]|uniref:HPr family phosphocarrier protein n=1 Tax=Glycomyces terrestris TaxID=2493553 RepID=A0A426UWL2_9ACTN|nr:HPr family phosphocarrier protein [Glycomyces terrestris]RRR98589.1 HPr family phosphocarrier protein [Glycomyces terrestris]
MSERTVVIGSKVGLHLRPARLFVKAAKEQPVPVTIGRPGEEPVDAASMLLVVSIGAKYGDEVVLRAEGEGAEAALDALATVLATDQDAE